MNEPEACVTNRGGPTIQPELNAHGETMTAASEPNTP